MIYPAMDTTSVTDLAFELHRRAEQKFGIERADTLRNDLLQLARELDSLRLYDIGFDDEP
jgi:hypothetical protein